MPHSCRHRASRAGSRKPYRVSMPMNLAPPTPCSRDHSSMEKYWKEPGPTVNGQTTLAGPMAGSEVVLRLEAKSQSGWKFDSEVQVDTRIDKSKILYLELYRIIACLAVLVIVVDRISVHALGEGTFRGTPCQAP